MVLGTLTVAGLGYALARVFGGTEFDTEFLRKYGGTTIVFDRQYALGSHSVWSAEIVKHIKSWMLLRIIHAKPVTPQEKEQIKRWYDKGFQYDELDFAFLTSEQGARLDASTTLWADTLSIAKNEDELLQGIGWVLTAHLMGGKQWRIVDQNRLASDEAMYTGCWFDYLATAIVDYYPRIMDKLCHLLSEHGLSSDYTQPKDLIKKLRRCVFVDALRQYDTNEQVKEAVKVAVLNFDLSDNVDEGSRALARNSVKTPHRQDNYSMLRDSLEQYETDLGMRNFPKDLERAALSKPRGKRSADDEDILADIAHMDTYYKDRFTYDVLCFAQNSCGANASIFNELMAYTLGICIVHVEATIDQGVSHLFHEYLNGLPDGGFYALTPSMRVTKVINLPRVSDAPHADDLTVWSFVTNVGASGHAMFMVDHTPSPWALEGEPCEAIKGSLDLMKELDTPVNIDELLADMGIPSDAQPVKRTKTG